MIRALAIFVALMTMAPPSAWCCCRQSLPSVEQKSTNECNGSDSLDDCKTCAHHQHDNDHQTAPKNTPPTKHQDEPCRCWMTQTVLGITLIPEKVEIESSELTVFIDGTFSMARLSRVAIAAEVSESWLTSFDTSRARILRC